MPGTIHMLEATVAGLQYELHVRELRLKQQVQRIRQLEQQVEELKNRQWTHMELKGMRRNRASRRHG